MSRVCGVLDYAGCFSKAMESVDGVNRWLDFVKGWRFALINVGS